MKTIAPLPLPLLSLLVTGCSPADSYPCPPKVNTTIYFALTDEEGNDLFSETVYHVELFIYNPQGFLVRRIAIPESELALFAGKRLSLVPGAYTLVAWANATPSRTQFVTNGSVPFWERGSNYVATSVAIEGVAENGDPLYYLPHPKEAPIVVAVPETGSVEVTAHLGRAHVKVEVSVEGYEHVAARYGAQPLKVELTHLTSRYSFNMEPHGHRVRYIKYLHPIGNPPNRVVSTSFHIPLFDSESTTQLHISNDAGQPLLPAIVLTELLGQEVAVDEVGYIPVNIKFTLEEDKMQVAVSAHIPNWNESPVIPNI